ncbi:MAG: T9SS type A sorting domain-containing protein [Candidatus Delongbacteria bacterium]|jgi:hypothetical protein|nr:T9SS type A sorting domain-containing protein [Candidatus Delongbacteria bacterium]
MKYNKLLVVFIFTYLLSAYAELVNINPDTDGVPWIVGGYKYGVVEEEIYNSLPYVEITSEARTKTLEPMVDNSIGDAGVYFRPVFHQGPYGNCAQAAAIGYAFTYEINRLRNLPASEKANQYPVNYTYNYWNQGIGEGTSFEMAEKTGKEYGIPNSVIWEEVTGDPLLGNAIQWMSGYEKYCKEIDNSGAMQNRILERIQFGLLSNPANDYQNIQNLKIYLANHGTGALEGGLAIFAFDMTHATSETIPSDLYMGDKTIFGDYDPDDTIEFDHAMTIVGYDDNVAFDFDIEYKRDPQPDEILLPLPPSNYEWDPDANDGNGDWSTTPKPMSEWEVGALKIANSWRNTWENEGFIYLPYRLLAQGKTNEVCAIVPERDHNVEMAYKLNLSHEIRNEMDYSIGMTMHTDRELGDAEVLEKKFSTSHAKSGGAYPMQGVNSDPIEFGLDVTDFFNDEFKSDRDLYYPKKFFFIVDDDLTSQIPNEVLSFELCDNRNNNELHIRCNENNKIITANDRTSMSIIYDVHLQNITYVDVVELSDNIGIPIHISISPEGTLILKDGANLYFHNSGITTTLVPGMSHPPSYMIIEGSSKFIGYDINSNEYLNLNYNIMTVNNSLELEKCDILLNNSSKLILADNSKIVVADGASLEIDSTSDIQFGNGSQIVVKSGGIIKLKGNIYLPNISNLMLEPDAKIIIDGDVKMTGELNISSLSRVELLENSSLTIDYDSKIYFGDETVINGLESSYLETYPGASINVMGNSTISADMYLGGMSNVVLLANTSLKLSGASTMSIEGNVEISGLSGSSLIVGEYSSLISLIEPDYNDVTPDNYIDFSGNNWKGIICEPNSNIKLTRTKISGAETAIFGFPNKLMEYPEYSCHIEQCEISNCESGINISECNNFIVKNNKFTGIETGTGITTIISDGIIENNVVENFNYGVRTILSSPYVIGNSIFNNNKYGIIVSGHNALPVLRNFENASGLNNAIYDNGSAQYNTLYPYGQIGIMPVGSIYLYKGMNNIYSGEQNTVPEIPCISTAGLIPVLSPQKINILAAGNYWGSSEVTDEFFALEDPYYALEYPYNLDYQGWAKSPFVSGVTPPPSSYSSIEPPTTESIILSNGFTLEDKENYKASIKQYEHVIDKYENTPEYYVALARLPYVYLKAGISPQPLISTYNDGLESEITTYKKFFKEMKIATHIKGKNYPEAKLLAEEMKEEALTEEEVVLAEIDIAICDMMMSGSKGGKSSIDHMSKLNSLLSKIFGDEGGSKEKTDIVESQLPTIFTLEQNYPNPFNPTTEIRFDLTTAGDVKLSVYNLNGQLISELVNGNRDTGIHTVSFDGNNLNSGMYFYTLEANGMSITKKMILTK